MKKKFFTNAALWVVGSSVLALVASIVYFAVTLNIDEGDTIEVVLIILKDVLSSVSMFIGYATIAYAFFKFGFYEAVMSLLIYIGSVLPHLIFQVASWNTFAEQQGNIVLEGAEAFESFLLGFYYSIGETVVNQILPAVLITFLACKIIRENKDTPTKIISWKNRSQRTMIVFCITMTLVNFIFAFMTGIFPVLLQYDFILLPGDVGPVIKNIVYTVIDSLIYYLFIAYTTFMLTYKLYEYTLSSTKDEQAKTKK